MIRPAIALLLIITAHIAPPDALADQLLIGPGTKVRLTVPNEGKKPLVGRITKIGVDGLTIEMQDQPTPMEIPFASVSKFEVNAHAVDRSEGFKKGAGRGLLVGAVGGVAIGFLSGDDDEQNWFAMTAAEKALVAGFAFGIVGAVFGGFLGAISQAERWAEVEVPTSELGLRIQPQRHGGLSLAISRGF